jgi:hypothetical protein
MQVIGISWKYQEWLKPFKISSKVFLSKQKNVTTVLFSTVCDVEYFIDCCTASRMSVYVMCEIQ